MVLNFDCVRVKLLLHTHTHTHTHKPPHLSSAHHICIGTEKYSGYYLWRQVTKQHGSFFADTLHTVRKCLNGCGVTLVMEFLMTSSIFFASYFPIFFQCTCITSIAKNNKNLVYWLIITSLCSLSQDVAFFFSLAQVSPFRK